MADLLFVGLLVGLLYALVTLGAGISFRVLGFPDLTMEGGAVFAGIASWAALRHGLSWPIACAASVVAGAIAGMATGLVYARARTGPFLSSLVVAAVLYSANFRLMGGWANVRLQDDAVTVFEALGERSTAHSLVVLSVLVSLSAIAVLVMFHLRFGQWLRAVGDDPRCVEQLGRSPATLKMLGLGVANGLVGLGAGLLAQYRRVVDVGVVAGLLVATLASLMLGESVVRPRTLTGFVLSTVAGSVLYSMVVSLALYTWTPRWHDLVVSTDVRGLTGLLILVSVAASNPRRGRRLFEAEW